MGPVPDLTFNYVGLYNSFMTTTFADANDEQFLSIVQAMADIDFNDSLDPSRLDRITKIPDTDMWYLR